MTLKKEQVMPLNGIFLELQMPMKRTIKVTCLELGVVTPL
jgi:hypothetical protein